MPEQNPEFAGIVGVLKRNEQIFEIATKRAGPEKIGIGQIDFVNQRRSQMRRYARRIELHALSYPPPAIGAIRIDYPFGKAPSGQARIARLDSDSGVWIKRNGRS